METDPNPPSFNIPMNVAPLNLGEDYAKGMTAGQAAGESVGKGITAAFDVATRNQNATDMLNAMQANKMLTPDQYNSIANKSLGAKEQMIGMFGNQWMADQANQRALALSKGQAGVEVAKQHMQMVDAWNQAKSGNVMAVGGAKNLPWVPNQGQPAPQGSGQSQDQTPKPPIPMKPNWPAGTKYGSQTYNGKAGVLGHQMPGGTFIPDPGQGF